MEDYSFQTLQRCDGNKHSTLLSVSDHVCCNPILSLLFSVFLFFMFNFYSYPILALVVVLRCFCFSLFPVLTIFFFLFLCIFFLVKILLFLLPLIVLFFFCFALFIYLFFFRCSTFSCCKADKTCGQRNTKVYPATVTLPHTHKPRYPV